MVFKTKGSKMFKTKGFSKPKSLKPTARLLGKTQKQLSRDDVLRAAEGSEISKSAMEAIPLIYDFTTDVVKRFGTLVKSVIVFGSFARADITQESDIDILVIIDDASIGLTTEVRAYYDKELKRLLDAEKKRTRFHVTTATLTEFWDSLLRGEPLAITILRSGIPVADAGFFAPLKMLLKRGRIRPTHEAIEISSMRALYHLDNYSMNTLNCMNSLYWAAIEAVHAALMTVNCSPASPAHVVAEMEAKLVPKGLASMDDVGLFMKLYERMKDIVHKKTFEIEAAELSQWKKDTTAFVHKMKAIADKYESPLCPAPGNFGKTRLSE